MEICRNCGHLNDKHNNKSCSSLNTVASKCTCKRLGIIEIKDRKTLLNEFYKAKRTHDAFLKASKGTDNVYRVKDLEKGILLYSKEVSLWKILNNN